MKPTKSNGGFSQLAMWVPTEVKNRIAARAAREGKDQKDVVVTVLSDHLDDDVDEKAGGDE